MAEQISVDCDFDFSMDEVAPKAQQQQQEQPTKQSKAQQMKEQTQMIKEIQKTASRLSPEETKKKMQLILKITQYEKSSFGEQLKAFGFTFGKSLKSLSIEELEDQIIEMQECLKSDPNSNTLSLAIYGITGVAEQITQAPKIKEKVNLLGWTASLKQNQEFNKTVELLSLQYDSFSSLSPEMKLMFIMASSGLTVAMTNKQFDLIRKQQEAEKLAQEKEKTKEEEGNDSFDPSQPIIEEEEFEETEEVPVFFESKTENTEELQEVKTEDKELSKPRFKLSLKK